MLKFRAIYIGILAIIVGIALYAVDFGFLKAIEFKSYDLRFRMRGHLDAHPDVLVVAIDAKSVDELGRWPWERSKIAKVVSFLDKSGASAVGLDIVFSEPETKGVDDELEKVLVKWQDTAPGRELLSALAKPGGDELLARALTDTRTVGGFYFITMPSEASERKDEVIKRTRKSLSNASFEISKGDSDSAFLLTAYDAEVNIPIISDSMALSGYFSIDPDPDGVIRRVPMAVKYENSLYAPISAKMISMYRNKAPLMIEFKEYGVSSYKIGGEFIPTDEIANMLINFHGPGGADGGTFEYFSFSDLYYKRIAPETFKNKLVLIGATETGIYDMRTTPFGTVYPGVEIHANAISNMLLGSYIKKGDEQVFIDLFSIIILGLILGWLLPKFHHALYCAVAFIFFLILYYFFIYIMFARFNMWLNAMYPTIVILLSYTGIEIYRNTVVEKKAKQIKRTFQNYVSSSVVDEMLKAPDRIKLGGEKKVLSVMFSDIRGFTSISESAEPEIITTFLNNFLTPMTEAIFEHSGTLDKYMGDCIMAIWGAPVTLENHAELSCRTALEMMKRLEVVRNNSTSHIGRAIDIGIGINSGEMVIGNMGSDLIMDYTVIGDNVNLASRLEGINKVYGTNIVISESTYSLIKDSGIKLRRLDRVKVKGKKKPVGIFELFHEKILESVDCDLLTKEFELALDDYRSGLWNDAENHFKMILNDIFPDDGPSKVYLERLDYFRKHPVPDDWDGVFVMKGK